MSGGTRFGDALCDIRRTGAAAESADICRRGVRVGSWGGHLRNISSGGTRRGQIAEQSRINPLPSPDRGCCKMATGHRTRRVARERRTTRERSETAREEARGAARGTHLAR